MKDNVSYSEKTIYRCPFADRSTQDDFFLLLLLSGEPEACTLESKHRLKTKNKNKQRSYKANFQQQQ